MKKYALTNVDGHQFVSSISLSVLEHSFVVNSCSQVLGARLFDSLDEAMDIVNFCSALSDGKLCLVVFELEVDE